MHSMYLSASNVKSSNIKSLFDLLFMINVKNVTTTKLTIKIKIIHVQIKNKKYM